MSLKFISAVWENTPLNGNLLLVMLALADYADSEGQCWPKVATLAKRARVSHRQAQRYLSELASKGYITRVTGMGRGRAVVYTVHPTGRGVKQVALQTVESDDDMDTGDNIGSAEGGKGDSYMSPPTGDSYMSPPSEHLNIEQQQEDVVDETKMAVSAYENEIGLLTPMVGENLYDAVSEYGGAWVVDAIGIAARNNARKWAYVEAVLRNWKAKGRGARDKPAGAGHEESVTISVVEGDIT